MIVAESITFPTFHLQGPKNENVLSWPFLPGKKDNYVIQRLYYNREANQVYFAHLRHELGPFDGVFDTLNFNILAYGFFRMPNPTNYINYIGFDPTLEETQQTGYIARSLDDLQEFYELLEQVIVLEKAKVRDLGISDNHNFNEAKEINHLIVKNINEFLEDYQSNLDYYSPPFSILAKLEEEIKFQNNPERRILVSYKPGGFIIFELTDIRLENDLRVIEYNYRTSIS